MLRRLWCHPLCSKMCVRMRVHLGRNFPEAPLPVAHAEAELRERAIPARQNIPVAELQIRAESPGRKLIRNLYTAFEGSRHTPSRRPPSEQPRHATAVGTAELNPAARQRRPLLLFDLSDGTMS